VSPSSFLPRFVIILLALVTPLQADLLKVADFETGDVSQLGVQKGAPDSVTVVSTPSPVRAGKHAAKTLLRASDPIVAKGIRAEFIDARTKILMDQDYWYGLSILLPTEFTAPKEKNAVLFQWHTQQGGPSPVLAIRVQGDEWVITANPPGKRRTLKRLPLEKNRWVDWVVHARWSATPTGYISIWKDDVEVVNEKDIITQYSETLGPYAKFGQYHSVGETDQNTVYVDEYRVGGPESDYDEVAPGKAEVKEKK